MTKNIYELDNIVSQHNAVEDSYKRFEENRTKEWGLAGHDFGIHDINMSIGGVIPKKLTTIAARSGVGKTGILSQLFNAGRRVMNGRRTEFLFFTWEMSPEYMIDRHICNRVGITSALLSQGAKLMKPGMVSKVNSAYEDAKTLPVVYQKASTNIEIVRELSESFVSSMEQKSKIEGVDIIPTIVIDYVGMAKFSKSTGLRTYDLGDFMNGMKQNVNDTGASAIILAQISRSADDRDYPRRSDLSDSKTIEDASDNLIILHRPFHHDVKTVDDPDDPTVTLDSKDKILYLVEKSRDFGRRRVLGMCDIGKYRFWSRNHDFEFDYWNLYSDENFWKKQFNINQLEL